MFSERHRTTDIRKFVDQWLSFAIILPKEAICDGALALLNALALCLTSKSDIYEYADECKTDIEKIRVRIRIDNAHFIKKYANLLKPVKPSVKAFYLAVIGQLIICTSIEQFEKILYSLFIVTKSSKQGKIKGSSQLTKCATELKDLKTLVTGAQFIFTSNS